MLAKEFALIRPKYQSNGIKWLAIEDKTNTGEGCFLLLYEDITKACKFDDWYPTLEEVFKFAKEDYGVEMNDWLSEEDLKIEGDN